MVTIETHNMVVMVNQSKVKLPASLENPPGGSSFRGIRFVFLLCCTFDWTRGSPTSNRLSGLRFFWNQDPGQILEL